MVVESFLVTALPYTARAGADVHVSLFVTHRLTPDDPAGGVLGDFPHVVDWGQRVTDAEVRLEGSDGQPIPVTVVPQVVPDRWPKVFPADLPVRGFPTPELGDAPWRTFPASRMDGYARTVHALAALLSPVERPAMLDTVLPLALVALPGAGGLLDQWLSGPEGRRLDRAALKREYERLLAQAVGRRSLDDPRRTSVLRHLELLEEQHTALLDEVTAGGTLAANAEGPLQQVMRDLHRARRFYERPEEQRPYREQPLSPPTRPQRPDPPEPDFHDRCSLLSDTPGLLRSLGLVIDLHVDDLTRLPGLAWIRGDLTVDGLDNPVRAQPMVTCQVDGERFTTRSATGDYVHGALRLGDEDRFQVLDLDPDASALKLERFVRTLPRLLWSALNGDDAQGAPAALRASGFALARIDGPSQLREQLTDVAEHDRALLEGRLEPLTTEDVTRGLRLEVWDDVTGRWRSVHDRVIDVEVDGETILQGEQDVGFLQGPALTQADEEVATGPDRPYHAHEVLAGWEGWSLSVPPVGKVVTDETGPLGDQPDERRVTPVAVRPHPPTGTLPRLRYGRAYAFRARAVDLAGNSPPPTSRGRATRVDPGRADPHLRPIADRRGRPAPGVEEVETTLHDGLRQALPLVDRPRAPSPTRLDDLTPTGDDRVDDLVRRRLAVDAASTALRTPPRRERIERATAEVVAAEPRLVVPTARTLERDVFVRAVVTATADSLGAAAVEDPKQLTAVARLVTPPRPLLRWDPVLPPAVVPRHRYTDGESLLTLVVRSGVTTDEDGTVVLLDPASYAAEVTADHPDLHWRADSQRHLAPPKSSQLEVERHGKLDDAFGPDATADDRRQALATSLREAGTFLDERIAHPTVPGQTVDQPEVHLHAQPTADPAALVELDDIADERGRPLAPGQYVAHEVDQLVLPYLADPLADGASLRFPDAGRDHRLAPLFATEGVRLPYVGRWPDQVPHRLVLIGAGQLRAEVEDHVVTIAVPPGERLRVRLSTSLTFAGLDLLGLWRGLPAAFRGLPVLIHAARDGWLWWLTPAEDLQLVHAVPRPVERPRVPILVPLRAPGDPEVGLLGVVDVHGPSTGRLDVEASWSEPVDDPAKDEPERIDRTGIADDTEVAYDEDLVVLVGPLPGGATMLPDGRRLVTHGVTHAFEDTRHRLVEYRVRATTRYREFFAPVLAPEVDDLSLVSEPVQVAVPSSARPPKPVVRDVLPLFRWDERTEPDQPFGLRRRRRAGLRVYLDRPWYVTGDGELLGVVLAPAGPRVAGPVRDAVSQWAADPIWRQDGPSRATDLPLVDLFHVLGASDAGQPGRPVGPAAVLPLTDLDGDPQVRVLGYQPEFAPDRKLWFVDIAFDPGTAFWPFVRLALVRYQPTSIAKHHLSPVVTCDFAQLTPERLATLTRPDAETVRVVVTGVVGERAGGLAPHPEGRIPHDRVVFARLEQRDPRLASDLAWVTRAVTVLQVGGRRGQVVSWHGTLPLPDALPPRRPGDDDTWRVTVEEWEVLDADGDLPYAVTREGRLVYADHLPL
jgi:hypothetical protein